MFQEEIYNNTKPVNAEAGLWDEEDVLTHPHPVIQQWMNEFIESHISWQDALICIFKDMQGTTLHVLEQYYYNGILTYEEFLIERVQSAINNGSIASQMPTMVSASAARSLLSLG